MGTENNVNSAGWIAKKYAHFWAQRHDQTEEYARAQLVKKKNAWTANQPG